MVSAVPVTLKATEITHFSMKIFCVLHILKEAFRPITLGFHHSLFILYLLFNCWNVIMFILYLWVYICSWGVYRCVKLWMHVICGDQRVMSGKFLKSFPLNFWRCSLLMTMNFNDSDAVTGQWGPGVHLSPSTRATNRFCYTQLLQSC